MNKILGLEFLNGNDCAWDASRNLLVTTGARGSNFYVRTWDVTNPFTPKLLGELVSTTIGFGRMALAGNFVYAACGTQGIAVIDITNKAALTLTVLVAPLSGGFMNHCAAAAGFLYTAENAAGVRKFSLASPGAPSVVASKVIGSGAAKAIAVQGTTVVVANNNSVARLDNQLNPIMVTGGVTALDVAILGNNIAAIAGSGTGLHLFDVSGAPVKKSSTLPPGGGNSSCAGVCGMGVKVGVSMFDQFQVYDVTNPVSPVPVDPNLPLPVNCKFISCGVDAASNTLYWLSASQIGQLAVGPVALQPPTGGGGTDPAIAAKAAKYDQLVPLIDQNQARAGNSLSVASAANNAAINSAVAADAEKANADAMTAIKNAT